MGRGIELAGCVGRGIQLVGCVGRGIQLGVCVEGVSNWRGVWKGCVDLFIFKSFLTFLTSAPSCLSSSLLPSSFVVYLLAPKEDDICRKRSCTIVSLCFVALVSTFPQICSIVIL